MCFLKNVEKKKELGDYFRKVSIWCMGVWWEVFGNTDCLFGSMLAFVLSRQSKCLDRETQIIEQGQIRKKNNGIKRFLADFRNLEIFLILLMDATEQAQM